MLKDRAKIIVMAQRAKTLISKQDDLLDPWDPQGGRREPTPTNHSHFSSFFLLFVFVLF